MLYGCEGIIQDGQQITTNVTDFGGIVVHAFQHILDVRMNWEQFPEKTENFPKAYIKYLVSLYYGTRLAERKHVSDLDAWEIVKIEE